MKALVVMIVVACVAAVIAIHASMKGSESPRVRTRAETPLSHASVTVATTPPADRPLATNLSPARAAATSRPDFIDLERELAGTEPGARDLILQRMLPALFAQDPERAARFAELQSDPALRELAVRQVALLWGAKDAERAINWARSLPDAAERDATVTDITNGLSSVDPARAVEFRDQWVGTATTDSALSNLVQQWAGLDFDAALAWTHARAPGDQRDDLMQRIIYVRAAGGDPAGAAQLITSLSGEAKAAAVASVAQEWEQHDAAAAREWLQGATSN